MYIDLLVKIKNAQQAKKSSLKFDYSKMDFAIAEALKRFGFLSSCEAKGRAPKKYIEVELNADKPIKGITFLSKPSCRVYEGYREMRKVKGGHGYLVLTTSLGVCSSFEARRQKVGGQKLFEIW